MVRYGSFTNSWDKKVALVPLEPIGFRMRKTISQRKIRILFQKMEKWLLGR